MRTAMQCMQGTREQKSQNEQGRKKNAVADFIGMKREENSTPLMAREK